MITAFVYIYYALRFYYPYVFSHFLILLSASTLVLFVLIATSRRRPFQILGLVSTTIFVVEVALRSILSILSL